jgi:hypothetical protein
MVICHRFFLLGYRAPFHVPTPHASPSLSAALSRSTLDQKSRGRGAHRSVPLDFSKRQGVDEQNQVQTAFLQVTAVSKTRFESLTP